MRRHRGEDGHGSHRREVNDSRVYGLYAQAKADWLAAHSDATAEEIEQASRLIAERLEL